MRFEQAQPHLADRGKRWYGVSFCLDNQLRRDGSVSYPPSYRDLDCPGASLPRVRGAVDVFSVVV